jgi:AraC family L-rhamnose operon transcriptional activator RhaR/AraC family L-rhamnose operon regulatory protein RhaS
MSATFTIWPKISTISPHAVPRKKPSIPTLKKHDWFPADGFPIVVLRREPQEPFGPHTHEFSELVIITGGHGLHVTGGESWPLAVGDVFVIGGTRPHEYRNLEKLKLINILFDPAKLRMDLADLPRLSGYHALFTLEPAWRKRHDFKSRLHLAPKELGVVTGHVELLEKELGSRAPGFAFFATATFMQIIGFLSRCYSQSRNPDSRALLRIADAMSHLEAKFNQPVNLDELAAIAHMSKRSFIRAFQAATGASPIAYLIKLRLNRAAALLRNAEEDVTSSAFKAGFNDSNYFARQFRKTFGIPPSEYRKRKLRA